MRLRLPVLLIAAVVTAACLKGIDLPDGRFGAVTAISFDDGTGALVLSPEAAFYDNTDLEFEPYDVDTCVRTFYDPTGQQGTSGLYYIEAGPQVGVAVSGHTALLPKVKVGSVVYYASEAAKVAYVPGDTLTVTVPGAANGFPASAISIRTAESFTHDSVVVPGANEALPIIWTTAPQPGSTMTVSLRYGFGVLNQPNEQVFCSFIDDGTASIPASYLEGWRVSPDSLRSTRFSRLRARTVDVDDRTKLSVISNFTRPLIKLQ